MVLAKGAADELSHQNIPSPKVILRARRSAPATATLHHGFPALLIGAACKASQGSEDPRQKCLAPAAREMSGLESPRQ